MKKVFLTLGVACCLVYMPQISSSQAASQYPLADKLADRIVQKYQTSSCVQLKEKKQQPPDAQKEAIEQKVIQQLKNDPAMRKHFLDRVAGPIANKMFDCGMIP